MFRLSVSMYTTLAVALIAVVLLATEQLTCNNGLIIVAMFLVFTCVCVCIIGLLCCLLLFIVLVLLTVVTKLTDFMSLSCALHNPVALTVSYCICVVLL